MTVLLEALLECCTFTILCKILPRRLLITNTKDSRHEFQFQLFFFVSNLSATINTIMKVKGRPFLSLFLMWQHQKVSCIVWFAHIFVAREVDISYFSSRWFITSIHFLRLQWLEVLWNCQIQHNLLVLCCFPFLVSGSSNESFKAFTEVPVYDNELKTQARVLAYYFS